MHLAMQTLESTNPPDGALQVEFILDQKHFTPSDFILLGLAKVISFNQSFSIGKWILLA